MSAQAFATLTAYNARLMGGDPREIRKALARQIAVLDFLSLHLARRAVKMKAPSDAAIVAKASVNAQQAAMRTLVALGMSAPNE